jgi:large subunit ribosomal protein L4
MPRKMRRLAVRSALSARYRDGAITFLDRLTFEKPRTKDMIAVLNALNLTGKTLIVLDQKDEYVRRSANNLPNVKTLLAHYLNVIDLLTHDHIVMLQAAVDVAQGYLDQPEHVVAAAGASEEEAS